MALHEMPADIPECWVGWGTAQHQQTSPYTDVAEGLWQPDLAMLVIAWLRVMPEDSGSNLPFQGLGHCSSFTSSPGELPKPTATSQPVPEQPSHLLAADLTASSGLQQQLDHFNTRGEESLGFSCQQQDRKWQLVKSHALKHCQV